MRVGFGRKKKKVSKKRRVKKKIKPMFYEDLTISDDSLIFIKSNMPEIKVPIVNDPNRLMNGVYFIVYALYVPVTNEINKKIENIESSIESIVNLLKVVAPVDIFVFNSGEIESGKLKLLLVFRLKFVRATEYGIEPIPDNIIIKKLIPEIEKKIQSIVNTTFKTDYSPKRVPITSLTSRQMRVIGFPPRRSYIIYDRVKEFEGVLADYTISMPIEIGVQEEKSQEVSEPIPLEEQRGQPVESERNVPIVPQPQLPVSPIRQPITPDSQSIVSSMSNEIKSTKVSEGVSIPEVPKEQELHESEVLPLPSNVESESIELSVSESEQMYPVSSPQITSPSPITQRIEYVPIRDHSSVESKGEDVVSQDVNVGQDESNIESVQQSYDVLGIDPECVPILNSIIEERIVRDDGSDCGVSVIHTKDEIGGHIILKGDDMLVDVVIGVLDEIEAILGCGESNYSTFEISINEISNTYANFLRLDDVIQGNSTIDDYDLMKPSDYYIGMYKIITGKIFNSGTTIKLLPIGTTVWGEKYYYVTEYCENPINYPNWQAVSNRVTLILGGMGSGKSHLGKYILELNALAGGSSVLIVTTPVDVREYYMLKLKINSIRERLFRCGCINEDGSLVENFYECIENCMCSGECVEKINKMFRIGDDDKNNDGDKNNDNKNNDGNNNENVDIESEVRKINEECPCLLDYEIELVKNIGIINLNIQIMTIAPMSNLEELRNVKFDYLFTLPVNMLTFGIIRNLITGAKKQEFVVLGKAFEMGIKGFYEFILNMYKRNPSIRHPLQIININPEDIGKVIPEDPDDDKEIPSFYQFIKALKMSPSSMDLIRTAVFSKVYVDPKAVEIFPRVFSDIVALKDKHKEFLQMFKGTSEPIFEDLYEPMPAKTMFTKEFVYEKMFKPYTFTVIFLPMEKDTVYKKVGVVMFEEFLKILKSTSSLRQEQISRNEPITPILVGIDEAHFYFEPSVISDVVDVETYINEIAEISRTSRKYSYGVILMSQLADDIPKKVFDNAGVKFIGTLGSKSALSKEFENKKLIQVVVKKLPKRWFLAIDNNIPGGYFLVSATRKLSDILRKDPYVGPAEEIAKKLESIMVDGSINVSPRVAKTLKEYVCHVKGGYKVEIPVIKIK